LKDGLLRGKKEDVPADSNLPSSAEREAIRQLIRAKSDREIARLLRQSHRLLNIHRWRRSSVSHRERWTDYELRLLGRIRDEELAKLLRRGVTAVAGKRKSLGISIFRAAANSLVKAGN